MKLQFDLSSVDFRVTPVENLFLQTYLPLADGNALKVYLYGWKACYQTERPTLSDGDIAQALSMTDEEVVDALNYWIDQGLVEEDRQEGHPVFRFKSILLLYAGIDEAKEEGADPAPLPAEDPGPDAFLSPEDRARKTMMDDLEDFLSEGRAYRVRLKANEIQAIHQVLNTYQLSPDFYLHAYKKAVNHAEASSRSFNYVTAIVENWVRFEGITDKEALDKFLDKEARDKEGKEGRRPGPKKEGAENTSQSKKMSRKDREEWVKEAMEKSRRRSLRGNE